MPLFCDLFSLLSSCLRQKEINRDASLLSQQTTDKVDASRFTCTQKNREPDSDSVIKVNRADMQNGVTLGNSPYARSIAQHLSIYLCGTGLG